MAKPTDWLKIIFDISDKLTIKRIFATLLAGIFISCLYVSYENRENIFKYIVQHGSKEGAIQQWQISQNTKIELVTLSSNSQLINFIAVSSVDLQLNKQEVKYWFIDIDSKADLPNYDILLPQPVFNSDQQNTNAIVSILGNEFVCRENKNTIFSNQMRELQSAVPVICQLAIPPFYGRFVGIITLGLTQMPHSSEKDSLKLEASRLAVEIYFNDVVKQK